MDLNVIVMMREQMESIERWTKLINLHERLINETMKGLSKFLTNLRGCWERTLLAAPFVYMLSHGRQARFSFSLFHPWHVDKRALRIDFRRDFYLTIFSQRRFNSREKCQIRKNQIIIFIYKTILYWTSTYKQVSSFST